MMEMQLSSLQPGETGIIQHLDEGGRGLTFRLRDLGFTEGSRVTFVFQSPLGDPLAYRIRGTLIALRQKDAALVTVCLPEGENI
ncbi:MAG: ferrous iron transport protein A [Ruminococcaceae bacterium]|nr:ferrous iron transport protein A [Oscillospiraceae bacterium]